MNLKKRAVQFTAGLLICLSLISTPVYAADYTVVTNDSLYKIGLLFKTPVSTLQNDNKISSSSIYLGQKLYVTAEIYKVKSGDTMYLIAKKYRISIS
jgi:LysM repeat protein